jgi:hypothetical protein
MAAAKPLFARVKPNGNVALFNAWLEVTGTAPQDRTAKKECIQRAERGAVPAHPMGIRDKPAAPAPPWQNGFAERLIGSIRRDWSSFWARRISAGF